MLKLRLEPATRPGRKEALARVGATGRFARKNVFEGPVRAAIRRREVEDIFSERGGGRGGGFIWNFVYFINNVKKKGVERGGCVVEGKGGREKQAAAGKKRRFELFCVDYDCKLRSEELQVRYCTD